MMHLCLQCKNSFEITAEDEAFYARLDVPEPLHCPECRQLARMAWRNERIFYSATCAWCKNPMVSCFSLNSPFQVLCSKCWWSDSFDPLKYGRDFDFSRSFFDQFWEHMKSVPIGNLFNASSENSEYSNYAVSNKNCYMVSASDYNEDSFYADNSNKNRDCCDVSFVNSSELLYECVDMVNSYRCIASQNLKNCNFCLFSLDLIGSSNCIGCVGLRNAEYCIFNKKMSKEEYEATVARMGLGTKSGFQKVLDAFLQFKPSQPRRFSNNLNSEASVGDYIVNSKNCFYCFDMYECDQCRYSSFGYKTRDAYDIYGAPACELAYQVAGATTSYKVLFSCLVWPGSSDVYYSFLTRMSKNCLGCVSLHKNEYCIFNRQYSKAEYEALFKKIKAHMQRTGSNIEGERSAQRDREVSEVGSSGSQPNEAELIQKEWGNFFPMKYAPWSYNETVAFDYYPKTKEEVTALPGRWEEQLPGTFGKETMRPERLPDDIRGVQKSITNEILACESCGRNYKIILQELEFYKNLNVPLPRRCPTCRYKARLAVRNPRTLWKRPCSACSLELTTSFSPERKERVLCESCYRLRT